MKRFVLLLLLAVLLAGCNQDLPEGTQPTETTAETTQPTQLQLPGIYEPDSVLEQKTFGAIRTYIPTEQQILGLTMMGERLLVVSADENDAVKLTLYEGIECVPVCTAYVNSSFRLDGAAVNVTDTTISYFDDINQEAVLMSKDLLEQERVVLPAEMVGEPAISKDFSTVYYTTGTEIRVLDIKTGITRLLRTMNCQAIQLQSVCFDNTLLECLIVEEKETHSAFLSTETGETLGTDEELLSISTVDNRYFLQRRNASVVEHLYGRFGEEPRALNPVARKYECYDLSGISGALTASPLEDIGLNLDLYDLVSGNRKANVVLPGYQSLFSPVADAAGKSIWFAVSDAQGNAVICRWDFSQSGISNATDYTSVRYTRESPDTEGLASCQAWANELSQQYGVKIALVAEDIRMSDEYTAVSEYQVPALELALTALKAAMKRFPNDFFVKLAQVSADETLHISLVQSIRHDGDGSTVDGLRYWIGDREYISLVIRDGMEQSFYHEICHALDTYVLANSGVLDTWEDLNPDGFQYDESYNEYQTRTDMTYLEGENRAFVDSYSMTYPMEDRARIFEYAMQGNREEIFASQTMQAKLKLLCRAIRDAFGWKEDAREFPWEQYLEKPMAYTQK